MTPRHRGVSGSFSRARSRALSTRLRGAGSIRAVGTRRRSAASSGRHSQTSARDASRHAITRSPERYRLRLGGTRRTTREVPMQVREDTMTWNGLETWYRVYGELDSGSPLTPVVICHGG